MLKRFRQVLAAVAIIMVTLLFLDFTGTAARWFGWMAKIQFLPALLALNAGVVIALVALTLLFGRLYCSIICPLGIMQDGFAAPMLRNYRRHAIVFIMVLAAIITPTSDAFTLMLVFVPIWLLYEASILIIR